MSDIQSLLLALLRNARASRADVGPIGPMLPASVQAVYKKSFRERGLGAGCVH